MSKKRNPNGMGSYSDRSDGGVRWRLQRNKKKLEISARTLSELQKRVTAISPLPIVKDKEKHTVEKWFESWLELYIKPLKKQATYDQYENIYRNHIKPVIGAYRMTDIKSMDIQKVIATMNKNNRSTKTMKHAKTIMSCAFIAAYKRAKIIPENPVVDIEIPVKQAKKRKVLSIEELSKLFKIMEHSRWIWSIQFMLVTGLRRGELLALKWSDIDWKHKRITIDKSDSSTGLGDTKSSKVHYVPLSDKAIECLKGQTDMLKKESNLITINKDLSIKKDLKETEYLVFPTVKGEMIKPNTYYHTLCRFAEKAGIKAYPHSFRHTFVYMTRKKISLKDLQNALGHDESTTTLDIYGDILDESSEETAKQIDDVFAIVDEEFIKIQKKKKTYTHLKLVK
jgi:integrase